MTSEVVENSPPRKDTGDEFEGSQLKDDVVKEGEDLQQKDSDADTVEVSELKGEVCHVVEDSKLKDGAGDVDGDSERKDVAGDAVEDSQMKVVGDAGEDLEPKGNAGDMLDDEVHDPQSTPVDKSENGAGGDEAKKWPGWPGTNVFRILVPAQMVGAIIGRKGESIKKITEETKARVKVLDGAPGISERAVMVSAKEEPDTFISPAMDGLLRVHKQIIGIDSDSSDAKSGAAVRVVTRLLVADTQGRSLIGKQGSSIKAIQDASDCTVRVLGSEHLPVFALQDDSVVEIQGAPLGVHKAVELIAGHLRKFLVDRSIVSVFETEMQKTEPRWNQKMSPRSSWGPQGLPGNSGGRPGFGPTPDYFQSQPDYYQSSMQPMIQSPCHVPHDRHASMLNAVPHQSLVKKVMRQMQIPRSYAEVVIGTSGANVSYIRRASGADIVIQETMGVPGELTIEISGSASQIQAAQQLIQNFMAEASSGMEDLSSGPLSQAYNNAYPAHENSVSVGQRYGSYPADGLAYASEATGHSGQGPAGDYGSVYGASYGY